jgi:hypothetical protein
MFVRSIFYLIIFFLSNFSFAMKKIIDPIGASSAENSEKIIGQKKEREGFIFGKPRPLGYFEPMDDPLSDLSSLFSTISEEEILKVKDDDWSDDHMKLLKNMKQDVLATLKPCKIRTSHSSLNIFWFTLLRGYWKKADWILKNINFDVSVTGYVTANPNATAFAWFCEHYPDMLIGVGDSKEKKDIIAQVAEALITKIGTCTCKDILSEPSEDGFSPLALLFKQANYLPGKEGTAAYPSNLYIAGKIEKFALLIDRYGGRLIIGGDSSSRLNVKLFVMKNTIVREDYDDYLRQNEAKENFRIILSQFRNYLPLRTKENLFSQQDAKIASYIEKAYKEERIKYSDTNYAGETLLHIALKNNFFCCASKLLEAGWSIRATAFKIR